MAAANVGYARRPFRKWESWTLGILSIGMFIPVLWVNLVVLLASIWFFLGKKGEAVSFA